MDTSSVQSTYTSIASHFDKTRNMIWLCVQNFINSIPKTNRVLDAGCGNGKNIKYMLDNGLMDIYAFDICISFVDMCRSKYFINEKQSNIIQSDIRSLPYLDNTFDNIISIAVIHHLTDKVDRKKAIDELIRIVKSGGSILITVCSKEEPFYIKKLIPNSNILIDNPNKTLDINEFGDAMVPWKNAKGELLGSRYYHFFEKEELLDLCTNEQIAKINYTFEMSNHCIVLFKK